MHVNKEIDAVLASLNHASLPGIDLSLDRMRDVMVALGNPERKLPPVIHVAGTNGKGSTISFLRQMLEADGKQVHVYTSPHLVSFNERIVICGKEVCDELLLRYLQRVSAAMQTVPATFFEATTAAAFLAFAENPADVLLLEVGMGGRFDATNLIAAPLATVITPVALDHQEFLGADLAAIAREKAGILKAGVPCFSAPQHTDVLHVLQDCAAALGAPLTVVDRPWEGPLGMAGEHQRYNAALAAAVLRHAMPVSAQAEEEGVRRAHWPARLQLLRRGPLVEAWAGRGTVVLDGGHNAHAAHALATWVAQQKHSVVMIAGMMARKDAQAFFVPLAPHLSALITIPIAGAEDGYEPTALAKAARAAGVSEVAAHASLAEALEAMKRHHQATLLIAGSLYLAGEVLKNHE